MKTVREIALEALELGMKIRQDQLLGNSDKSGKQIFDEWFDKHYKEIKK